MVKHIFNIACSEDIVGSDSRHKKIKLVGNVNGEEKTIEFCGPCTGAYGIFKKNGQDLFNANYGLERE